MVDNHISSEPAEGYPASSSGDGQLLDFFILYMADIDAGGPRPLAEYLARFPDVSAEVEREFHALATASGRGKPSIPPPSSSRSPDSSLSPESVFARWLERIEAGEEADLEAVCREHPLAAEKLHELHAQWRAIEDLRLRFGLAGPAAERLSSPFVPEIDPKIELDDSRGESKTDFTSKLLSRLSGRHHASARYRLTGEIAQGGMGAILRVWDEDLRRHLAMKVLLGRVEASLRDGTRGVDTRRLARFLEEAQVTGQLDHPGIVPVHELGLDAEGRVYFTMKLVKGRDLKRIFDLVFEEKEGWNETRALSVILKVCEAMAYAHTKGVIHRDLKPANVMVGNFGEVYVMDWGIARVLGRKDSHDIRIKPAAPISLGSVKTERRDSREEMSDSPIVTMDGDVVGTPAYMPPEQAGGEIEKLSPRSDVYAIGAMLYHLLARQAPYVKPGMRVSNHILLAMVLQGPPLPLSRMRKDVSAELVAICEKAMAREAADRYADTLELAEDLRAYLEHRVVRAYETGASAEARKWVQRNKPLAAALAGVMLVLAAGIALSTAKWREAQAARSETAARNADLAQANTELTRANAMIQSTNTELQATNTALVEAKQTAEAKEDLASRKATDVMSLSAIQELKDLVERADALWPAVPDKLTEYEGWLADAQTVIEGRAADPSRGIVAHPGLKAHEAKLAEIRHRAKPWTAEQVEADRQGSPNSAQWNHSRTKLTWLRCMLGEERWPSESEVEAQLEKESLPSHANGLNNIAWSLVDPDPAKAIYGSEVRALILARRALAAAQEGERAAIRDTLAWALYRCGLLDEALSEAQRAVDEAQDQQKEALSDSQKQLESSVADWRDAASRTRQADEVTSLSTRVAELERALNERRSYEFDDAGDRWWQVQLSQLVADLKAFHDPKRGLYSAGTSEEYGWGVLKRAEFARTIEERSVSGSEAKRRWDEAIASIAEHPRYHGLVLTPQLGLLPIGMDPSSGLWEFAHLQTGAPAERGDSGKLIMKKETGLVFVLIPAGRFWMGAQNRDASGRNYDPQTKPEESSVHEVELSAYFLSKYEMTQAQWERISGRNPSGYGLSTSVFGDTQALRHPVQSVTWTDCESLMGRLGLSLPSEAQWENGCRAGNDAPWWTGAERESLRGKVNVADQTAMRMGATWADIMEWPDLEDGWAAHAPVGSLVPNPYGLHEVHGNVLEWCQDGYDPGFSAQSPAKDPVTPWKSASSRVARGGSYSLAASFARSAARVVYSPDSRDIALGLRPATGITP